MGKLNRELNLGHALSIVIGTIIGTGIFLKTSSMTAALVSADWVLLAWVVAGVLSFVGALAYGELSARFPSAGGEYVFLKEAYGDKLAFLFGWTRFLIAGPGSIAAYSVGAATFLGSAFPQLGGLFLAILFIAIFTIINLFPVRRAGDVQGVLTLIKFGLLFLLIFGTLCLPYFKGSTVSWNSLWIQSQETGWPGISAFAAAVVSALWAYDGWNNLVMAAGEVKNPKRNLPLALGVGFLVVLVLYLLVNIGYFVALPLDQLRQGFSRFSPDSDSVGLMAYASFLGKETAFFGLGARALTALALSLSALGAMNGSILTGARVPFAMGQDGVFFKSFGKTTEVSAVPYVAVMSQGILAILFACSGSFDQITDMVVFSSWIFYGACVASLFKWRGNKNIQTWDGYQMPGYPVLPAIFVLSAGALLVATWVQNAKESTIGLGLIIIGLPFYYYCAKLKPKGDA